MVVGELSGAQGLLRPHSKTWCSLSCWSSQGYRKTIFKHSIASCWQPRGFREWQIALQLNTNIISKFRPLSGHCMCVCWLHILMKPMGGSPTPSGAHCHHYPNGNCLAC